MVTDTVRSAQASDIGQLAKLWYESWYEAHAHLMPAETWRYEKNLGVSE